MTFYALFLASLTALHAHGAWQATLSGDGPRLALRSVFIAVTIKHFYDVCWKRAIE